MESERYRAPIALTMAIGLVGLGLISLAAAVLYRHQGAPGTVQAPAAAASSAVSVVDGATVVELDLATQRRNGIHVEPLVAQTSQPALTVYGSVLDLQPLIDLRARRDAALSSTRQAQARATAAQSELERVRSLYDKDRNVSLKAYQAAQASDQVARAQAQAATLATRNIEAAASQQFGPTLARWAFDPASAPFASLLARRDVLVRVVVPPPATLSAARSIEVQASGGKKWPGTWVALSAQAEPGLAGTSVVYRVHAPLASGSAIVAYLPVAPQPLAGVLVPAAAAVWFAGQPWVYVQQGPTRFARRPLEDAQRREGGYFVSAGLQPGERVVTGGAGLLLSEEQRPPPGGAGCKDPECDG